MQILKTLVGALLLFLPYSVSSSQPLVGTPDANGCYPSAGYIWCDAKQRCIRPFEEDCAP